MAFDFYIQSSIHVGLAVFCLLYVTLLELDLSLQINFASCLFFGTVLAYTVLKYWDYLVVKKQITTYLKRILLVNSFALLGFVFFFLRYPGHPCTYPCLFVGGVGWV